ncbi:MAG: S9 family peptidase [Actinobacteria bacterium]|nr:S9 family peptidase [Actinomycetota bacterium]
MNLMNLQGGKKARPETRRRWKFSRTLFSSSALVLVLVLVCTLLPGCSCVIGNLVERVKVVVSGVQAYGEMSNEAADGYDVREARANWYKALEAYNNGDLETARQFVKATYSSLDNLEKVAERIYYRSSGGIKVSGLLFRPEEGKGPWPLVVVNHAGFGTAADFSDVALIVRDKGYLVFNPDFRGSGESEGEWELAKGEVDDVISGIEYVKSLGIVDDSRVGIYGQSHGATVALIAAGKYPGIKAVVAEAGFTDMRALEENVTNSDDPAIRKLGEEAKKRLGRNPTEEDYYQRTALNFVDGVQAAVLIIHGGKDPLIPVEQATTYYEKMKAAGKWVELKIYPDDEHCVTSQEGRKEVWDLMFNWFEKYL